MRLTRRSLLAVGGGAAVAHALPALSGPVAVAAPRAPRLEAFSMALGGDWAAAAAAAAGRVTTRVLRAPRRFDLVGVQWRGAARLEGEVRVRPRGGRWSPWVALGQHGPAGTSDPVWAGGADELQLRVARGARDLRLRFVNSRGVPQVQPVAHAAANQPTIIPRTQWDPNNECPPRGRPSYGSVRAAFVHHTVSANAYGPGDSAAIVLAICKYHRNSRGWADVGYNFLVDRYGQIFEGRAGGIDRAVVGAQAQGYNAQSTGISTIGTFDGVPLPGEAIRACGQLIAWKLALHGAPVTGPVTLTSAGGSQNRFPSGAPVTVERVSGHRDVDKTSCPGNALYGQLAEIRRVAAAQPGGASGGGGGGAGGAAGSLTAAAAATAVPYGQPVALSGRLSVANAAPAGQEVEIQKRGTSGGFRTVDRVQTGGDGTWSAAVQTTRDTAVRARWPGAAGQRPLASAALRISVLPRIAARARTARVAAGGTVVVSGQISPTKRRLVVEVARRQGRGYARLGTVRLSARGGGFAGKVRLARPGLYRLTVRFEGDARNAKVDAAPVYVRATPARRRARARTGT